MKSSGAYNDASEQQAAGNARALRYDFAALFQLLADTPDCYVDAVDNVYAPHTSACLTIVRRP